MENSEKIFLAESKVILLYILNKVDVYISYNIFVELVANLSEINYFLFEEVLADLLKERYIIKKEEIKAENDDEDLRLYRISDEGRQILKLSLTMLPGIKKLQIDTKFKEVYQKLKEEKSTVAEYKALEDGSFIVFLRVIEFEKVEFEIKVNAYSKEQVQKIINKWKKDATTIYNQIIQLLNNDW